MEEMKSVKDVSPEKITGAVKQVVTEQQQKELNEAFQNYLAYVNETIAMLPPEKKRYWTERIAKAGTWQTKKKACEMVRERYQEAYLKKMEAEQEQKVVEVPKKKGEEKRCKQ